MSKVVNVLLSKIREHNPGLSEAQLKTREFGLEVLLSELSKILLYLIVFSIFSLTWYFLLSMLIYCTTRVATGGYHARSYWGCLTYTFIGFAIPVFCGQYVALGWQERLAVLLASLVITAVFAPVLHKNTPKRSLAKTGKFKVLSIALVTFWSSIAFLLPGAWSVTSVLTIFVEAAMQPLGKQLNPVLK